MPILIVDGNDRHRARLAELVRASGYRAHEFATGADALAEAARCSPSLVLLEVSLRDVSGYEVCRELRRTFGDALPIMFVSNLRTEPYDRVGGLLLGADDYVAEPFAPDELLARIRRLRKRGRRSYARAPFDLTKRELEVLSLLASGRGQRDIASTLVIAERTVSTHLQRILVKLGVHSRAEAVAAAHRHGLAQQAHVAAT